MMVPRPLYCNCQVYIVGVCISKVSILTVKKPSNIARRQGGNMMLPMILKTMNPNMWHTRFVATPPRLILFAISL